MSADPSLTVRLFPWFAGALLLKDILNTKVAAVRGPHSPHWDMVSLKGNLSQVAAVPGMAV